MSNQWRRRDRDGGKQHHRRRRKADQFYGHKEDDRDDATLDKKRRRRGKDISRRYREISWEDEAMSDAGDDADATEEQAHGHLGEHPGEG